LKPVLTDEMMRSFVFIFTIIWASIAKILSLSISPITQKYSIESFSNVERENPDGIRLFHPAFPLSLLSPISSSEAQKIIRVKELTGSLDSTLEMAAESPVKCPWLIFPKFDIPDTTTIYSKSDILNSFEKHRHLGHFVWAHLISRPRKGCLLVNHWKQQVLLITEYDVERGAKGFELNHRSFAGNEANIINWPPLALEIEIGEGKWQPVNASDNILSGEIIRFLPPELSKSVWELILLLLVSPKDDSEVFQALMDTGLSPRKGLIAYLRLLNKVIERTETNEGTPSYRQIVEKDIYL